MINAVMLEVFTLLHCNVVNLMHARGWNYMPVDMRGLRIILVTFLYLTQFVLELSIHPIWRRVTSVTSMTSLHIVYKQVSQKLELNSASYNSSFQILKYENFGYQIRCENPAKNRKSPTTWRPDLYSFQLRLRPTLLLCIMFACLTQITAW